MRLRAGKEFNHLVIFMLLASLLSGCNQGVARINLPSAAATKFASYEETPVKFTPNVKLYQVANDLSNISNREQFQFSPSARQLLQQNAFVVVPGKDGEFYQLYNSQDNIPNFITTDALLHTYHLYFDYLLKNVEKQYLIAELKQLNAAMLIASQGQYATLKGTGWENAARRNLAFFTVASKLADPQIKTSTEVIKEVEQELALIARHSEVNVVSPIMNMGNTGDRLEKLDEDYTQYIPRGHYTQSPELQNFFKTMMWYGRLTFRVKNEDETRSAVLMTLALSQPDKLPRWGKIYDTSKFFVGSSDDIDYYEYRKLLRDVYGTKLSLSVLTSDTDKWTIFRQKAAALNPPPAVSLLFM